VETVILLSILEYERELSRSIPLEESKPYDLIRSLLSSVQGVHIDMIRPPFSEETCFQEDLVNRLCSGLSETTIELHIMSEDPIPIFESVKTSLIRTSNPAVFLHLESFKSDDDAAEALKRVELSGCKTGVVIDLQTSVNSLKAPLIEKVDVILVMSVKAGSGGRKFDPASLSKIRKIRELFPAVKLEVDGGIDEESGRLCLKAGADILVVGSRITKSSDPFKAVEDLKTGLRKEAL